MKIDEKDIKIMPICGAESLVFDRKSSNKKKMAKPHAILVPVPFQGHINPMFKLAKLLHNRGFYITFVNTEFNHRRLLRSRGAGDLEGLPTFQFCAIPDGIPPSNENATQEHVSVALAITSNNFLAPFRDLVFRLNNSEHVPPVTCIVSDSFMTFTFEVSENLGIPNVIFWTPSSCGVLIYTYLHKLIENGLFPLKDESCLTNGYMENVINWIPGLEGIKLKNFPTQIRTTDPNDVVMKLHINQIKETRRASAVILNTFDNLESRIILQELSSKFPMVLTLGPFQLLEKNQVQNNKKLDSIGTNLWKEDPRCLTFLDSKPENSVLLVSFGTIAHLTPQQLIEFGWGLANSNQNFLWVIRSDLVLEGTSSILPKDFQDEIKERGLISSWCPQEKVLNHPSIGGFLTHCGWNSMLESISAGVPMLCWPAFAEQPTNAWFCCNYWGVGLEIEVYVKRDEVEKLVKEIMNGEEGKKMKERATELKKEAEMACCSINGSSFTNFEHLVKLLLSGFAKG